MSRRWRWKGARASVRFNARFLESVPEVSTKLKEANTREKKFEDVVKEAEQAAVLVLVY